MDNMVLTTLELAADALAAAHFNRMPARVVIDEYLNGDPSFGLNMDRLQRITVDRLIQAINFVDSYRCNNFDRRSEPKNVT